MPKGAAQQLGDGDVARRVALAAPILLTKSESAAVSRRSVRTIERAMAAGELHATGRPGQRRLIDLRELERWLGTAAVLVLVVLLAFSMLVVACRAGVEPAQDVLPHLHCRLL